MLVSLMAHGSRHCTSNVGNCWGTDQTGNLCLQGCIDAQALVSARLVQIDQERLGATLWKLLT